ncbi:hypothetical protein [Prosthecobacter sp.]|uniref:hypothetical protein n=1 Tax=Prosthecobacter sp. TaxID=1965333 RepID=UPI002AB80BF7|nr:hypothetical protein [Prosthecobacter sp.]MDZ4405430.1 hypothetical protein [Prosthecobacter sp.]
MNTPTVEPAPDWLIFAIVGGFLVVFPLFWCLVVWILSRVSGWHRLAARHASASRPVTGARHDGVTGMVGGVSHRGTLTLHFDTEGFFLEVMPLFRIGHPRLFIPWSEITGRRPFAVLWWKAMRLSVGQPIIATITLPTALVEKHDPA